MNTFFYSAAEAKCNRCCDYPTCSRRCLALLSRQPFFQSTTVLPAGSGLKTPNSMELRSGDILLLYAANQEEIDQLVAIGDHFDTFRVILIIGDEELADNKGHYSLKPRYTVRLQKNMERLGDVIARMLAAPTKNAELLHTQPGQSHA